MFHNVKDHTQCSTCCTKLCGFIKGEKRNVKYIKYETIYMQYTGQTEKLLRIHLLWKSNDRLVEPKSTSPSFIFQLNSLAFCLPLLWFKMICQEMLAVEAVNNSEYGSHTWVT